MNKIFYILIFVLISALFYGIFNQVNKSSIKSKRLSCQNKTITFEKISINKPIKEAVNLLESNNIIISSNIEYSKYMKSHLVNKLTIKDLNYKFDSVLAKFIKNDNSSDDKLAINYYVYENDKKDTGKKGKKSKLYAGYLLFEFKLNNQLIYKIQTDYMDIDAKDLEERMNCVLESFTSLK